jgi:AcrR family transcriptional regulator
MTRPADLTRQSILRAAINLFAEKGFEGASVRDIVGRAKVNQAAINYHFEGKEGLYAEVLKAALDALTRQAADAAALADLPREAALRQFVHEQLRPLLHRDEAARYMRIFAWESVQPTKVMRKFMATNATPYLRRSLDLLRRFLPTDTPERDLMCAAIWLMGQCSIFVRNRENFAQPPFAMKIDEAFVDGLTDLVTRLAIGGLTQGRLASAAG